MNVLANIKKYASAIIRLADTRRRVFNLSKQMDRADMLTGTVRALEKTTKELRDQNAGLRSAIVGLQATLRRHERLLLELTRGREGQ
jgi:hypothetical protein